MLLEQGIRCPFCGDMAVEWKDSLPWCRKCLVGKEVAPELATTVRSTLADVDSVMDTIGRGDERRLGKDLDKAIAKMGLKDRGWKARIEGEYRLRDAKKTARKSRYPKKAKKK